MNACSTAAYSRRHLVVVNKDSRIALQLLGYRLLLISTRSHGLWVKLKRSSSHSQWQ